MINQQLTEVTTIHTILPNYWPHFIASPYAYYNHESVYLYQHPQFNGQEVILPWNNQFTGSTSIIFENEATAVVDINNLNKEEVYATLIHELFHCHQYHMKEKRFPNELVGIAYPLERENIQWRIQERECLNRALSIKNINKQREAIQAFIYWREKEKSSTMSWFSMKAILKQLKDRRFLSNSLHIKISSIKQMNWYLSVI